MSAEYYKLAMNRLRAKGPLYLTRFGDGEHAIMNNRPQNRMRKIGWKHKDDFSGWKFNTDDESHKHTQQLLHDAFNWRHQNHILAVYEKFKPLLVDYPKSNISHFRIFIDQIVDVYDNWGNYFNEDKIIMVSHRKSNLNHLPFVRSVVKHIQTVPNILSHTNEILGECCKYANINPSGMTWFFCAGPFSCVAIHHLAKKYPNNKFIDAGSVFDPIMGLGATRGCFNKMLSDYKHPVLGKLI